MTQLEKAWIYFFKEEAKNCEYMWELDNLIATFDVEHNNPVFIKELKQAITEEIGEIKRCQ